MKKEKDTEIEEVKDEKVKIDEKSKTIKGTEIKKRILKVVSTIVIVVLIILIAVALIYFCKSMANKKSNEKIIENLVENEIIADDESKEYQEVLTLGLKDMGQLITQSAYAKTVKDSGLAKDKWFFGKLNKPFSGRRVIFSYYVKIDAGIDLVNVEEKITKDKITIKLPHADVLSASTDQKSLHIYYQEGSFSVEELNDAWDELKEEAIKEAKENGLLEAADNYAKVLIENIIRRSDVYKNHEIVFEFIENEKK